MTLTSTYKINIICTFYFWPTLLKHFPEQRSHSDCKILTDPWSMWDASSLHLLLLKSLKDSKIASCSEEEEEKELFAIRNSLLNFKSKHTPTVLT